MNKDQMLADVFEALEFVQKYKPVYLAILKKTGSKQQAIDALLFLKKMEDETCKTAS